MDRVGINWKLARPPSFVVWWALIRALADPLCLCVLCCLGSGHEASLGVMADEDDVAEDWEDVDTEVRKALTENLVKMSHLFPIYCFCLIGVRTSYGSETETSGTQRKVCDKFLTTHSCIFCRVPINISDCSIFIGK